MIAPHGLSLAVVARMLLADQAPQKTAEDAPSLGIYSTTTA
jgi:hypothetical protein